MVIYKASKYILSGGTPGQSKCVAYRLLLNHGYIHPVGSGLYSLLPLGQRVVEKLSWIVDSQLESIGAMKICMPILGSRGLWEKTSRWESLGAELFRAKDRHGSDWCLQPTAEEMCANIVGQLLPLKRNMFPLLLYQTTEKFRDEMNPRFGLLRARQFLMNDLYSFDLDSSSSAHTYGLVCSVYERIFRDILGLEVFKVSAQPGVHGGIQSHEYHLKSSLDEDGINFCSKCGCGSKREDGPPPQCECGDDTTMRAFSTVEVAHTFQLGNKYSKALHALSSDKVPLEMCCFGIGISRLVPAIVGSLSKSGDKVCLPPVIAPFSAAVIVSKSLLPNVLTELTLSSLARQLKGGVLLDDRIKENVGKRIKTLQAIGIPRIVVLGKVTQSTIGKTPLVEYITPQDDRDLPWENRELSLNELMQAIG